MLARLRPVLLLALPLLCAATDDVLFTSSVTYCEPPETLLIQQFDLTYFAHNQSISFDISAQSVEEITVSANILFNVYGITAVNITIDLCSILAGALCPLPTINFQGADTISLPTTLGVLQRLPAIAFIIPDLEAFAQVKLVDTKTGDVKACVQASLSNGLSTRQPGVEWGTGALTLFALVVALGQSAYPHALVPHRLLDLLHLFQAIATTALLSLNYPSLYRAFTLNFAWAMGLISSPNSKLQTSIDSMRALTGGNMANASSSSAVGLVNRKLSPWNDLLSSSSSSSSVQSFLATSLPANLTFSRFVSLDRLQQLDSVAEVQTVTNDSSNVLEAGLPIYVNSIHIATANAFMTTFLIALIVLAIAISLAALLYGVLWAGNRWQWGKAEMRFRLESSYVTYIRAWALRLGLIGLLPIVTFAFYQWSLKDSWLSVLLSVISFLAISALVFIPVYLVFRLVRQESSDALEVHDEYLASHGPLYAQYRTRRYYFFLPFLVSTLVKAIVIAAGQDNGMAQVVVFVLVEASVVGAHVVLKPFNARGGDILSTYLALVRLVCTGLMFAFVQSIGVAAIARAVIGVVIILIFSVAVLVLSFNLFLHSGILWLWRHRRGTRNIAPQESPNESMIEKGDAHLVDSPAALHFRSSSQSSSAVGATTRHSTPTIDPADNIRQFS